MKGLANHALNLQGAYMGSSKNVLYPYVITPPNLPNQLPNPVLQSLAASFTTPVTKVVQGDKISYQINIFSSDSTGTFNVQGSLDGINFSTIGPAGIVAAANDTAICDIIDADCFYYQLTYTPTVPGTGTCQIWVSWKADGG